MKKILFIIAVLTSIQSYGGDTTEVRTGIDFEYFYKQQRFFAEPLNYTLISSRYRWLAGYFHALHVPTGNTAVLQTGQHTAQGAIWYDSTGADSGFYVYGSGGVFQRLARASEAARRFGVPTEDVTATADRAFNGSNFQLNIDSSLLMSIGRVDFGKALSVAGAGTRMFWYPKKAAFRAGYVNGDLWDDANIGRYTAAFGFSNKASGESSVSWGEECVASGFIATAFGAEVTASGLAALGTGYQTTASGDVSASFNFETVASGNYSSSFGAQTQAQSYGSHAIGRLNIGGGNATSWVATDPLFEIGIGSGPTPANAMTVLKNGSVGIGTATPAASSLLEIASTTKGFLAPRMTEAQRDAIGTPATGLLIYQTNGTAGFYYYSGSAWTAIGGGGGGDVTKVGTPVNNQIGIWTGDGTIEGDANITWNGNTLYTNAAATQGVLFRTADAVNNYLMASDATPAAGENALFAYHTAGYTVLNAYHAPGANFNISNLGAGPLYLTTAISQPIILYPASTQMLTATSAGVGIGTATSPTARLHLPAGTASANTAPEKFTTGTDLTVNETGTVQFDGNFSLTKENAVKYGVGGNLTTNTTDVGNVGTGVDNLMTYSVPAGTLSQDGDYIEFTMTFTFAANANSKQVKVVYGATEIYASGAQAQSGGDMTVIGKVIRTGAMTQKITVIVTTDAALFIDASNYTTATETLSGAVVLKGTGEAVSNDDIIQVITTVKYYPAN